MAVQLGTSVHASDRVSTALPAAAATATPATPLDLGPQGGRNQPFLSLQVSCPATPSLANATTIIFAVTDCATSGGTYVAVADMAAVLTMTGAGGVGSAASFYIARLPDHIRRYVKVTATVLTGGGNNTAVSYVMEVVRDHQA